MEISVENIGRLCRICLKEGESKELCSILEETVAAINLKDILYLFIQDFKEVILCFFNCLKLINYVS